MTPSALVSRRFSRLIAAADRDLKTARQAGHEKKAVAIAAVADALLGAEVTALAQVSQWQEAAR